MLFDPTTDFGARVAHHLDQDIIVWLTTVRPDGTPEPSPVWFYWDGGTILIYSRPNTQKLRDIAANPRVSVNFAGDGQGGDIVILTGEARLDLSAPAADAHSAYLAKYEAGIAGIGMSPSQFAAGYSVPIRVMPVKVRGH